MQKSDDNADVFKATVHLDANKEFKFLTELGWGNLEYRAGAGPVTLQSGVEAPLVSSEDEPTDGKFFVSESANYDIVCNLATKKSGCYQGCLSGNSFEAHCFMDDW